MSIAPQIGAAHNELGQALTRLSDLDGALYEFQTALLLKSDGAGFSNLAQLYAIRGELEQAVQYYQESIKLRSDYALAHADLGKVFLRMGQPDQATVHLNEAVRLDPALSKQVNLDPGIGSKDVSNPVSVQHKQRIEEPPAVPSKALEHARLGKLLSRQGQTEQALIQFKEALRLNPNLPFCEVNFCQ